MKVILFCGGLGTRIREHAENVPKPMIAVGNRPILLHLMHYYAQYGHNDFVLCLGYKATAFSDFFLKYRPYAYQDCVISNGGRTVELIDGDVQDDWRVTLVDMGMWRNIGERLWAARQFVQDEEMFLANYSDGLTDVDLTRMIERFRASDKLISFLAVRPNIGFHFADIGRNGKLNAVCTSKEMNLWINGGYFIMRPGVFDYMREGEELVEEPFRRLVKANKVLAYKHEGFWRGMDTLKDKQVLDDLVEHGKMPWRVDAARKDLHFSTAAMNGNPKQRSVLLEQRCNDSLEVTRGLSAGIDRVATVEQSTVLGNQR